MSIAWRPIGANDVPAWTRLMAAMEEADRTGEHYDEDDLREELADPATGPDDHVSAWDGEAMVAYAGVRPRSTVTDYQRIDGEGGVAPSHRGAGLGTRLVEWTMTRSAAIRAERASGLPARVQLLGYLDRPDQVALFEDNGFEAVNWSAVMRIHLDAVDFNPEPAGFPDAFVVHRYDPRWSAPMRDAHNEAFKDHWGFVAWDEAMWHQWIDGSKNFRADVSWVVVDPAAPTRVAAYVQSNEFEAYEAATGRREAYLAKIGVRSEYRGCGLASALLRHALRAYRDQGYAESSLDVDTNNATGAFGLYERAGYRVEQRTATFVRILPEP